MLIHHLFETDLAMDVASRIARAKSLGFNVDIRLYHGTGGLVDQFRKKYHGATMGAHNRESFAVWLTTNPNVASTYAEHVPEEPIFGMTEPGPSAPHKERRPTVMPLFVRMHNLYVLDASEYNHYKLLRNKGFWIQQAKDSRCSGILFKNAEDGSDHRSDIYGIFNPRDVRSVFAQFDPRKKTSADLMA